MKTKLCGVLEYLYQLLGLVGPENERAQAICRAIAERVSAGHPEVIEAMVREAFSSEQHRHSIVAAQLLRPIAAQNERVFEALRSEQPLVRRNAVMALMAAFGCEKRVTEEIFKLCRDPAAEVRFLVSDYLSCSLEDPRIISFVVGLLYDGTPEEVATAAVAARRLESVQLQGRLWELLTKENGPVVEALVGLSHQPNVRIMEKALELFDQTGIGEFLHDQVVGAIGDMMQIGVEGCFRQDNGEDDAATEEVVKAYQVATEWLAADWTQRPLRWCIGAARCLLQGDQAELVRAGLEILSRAGAYEEATAVMLAILDSATPSQLCEITNCRNERDYEYLALRRLSSCAEQEYVEYALSALVRLLVSDTPEKAAAVLREVARKGWSASAAGNISGLVADEARGEFTQDVAVGNGLEILTHAATAAGVFVEDRFIRERIEELLQGEDLPVARAAEIGLHRVHRERAAAVASSIQRRILRGPLRQAPELHAISLAQDPLELVRQVEGLMEHSNPEIRRWGLMICSLAIREGLGEYLKTMLLVRLKTEEDEVVQDALFWVASSLLSSANFISEIIEMLAKASPNSAQSQLLSALLDSCRPEAFAALLW